MTRRRRQITATGRRQRTRLLAWLILFGPCLALGCADDPSPEEATSCPTGPRFARLGDDGSCPDRYLVFSAPPIDVEGLCPLAPEPLGCLLECSTLAAVIACGVRVSDGALFHFPYVTMLEVLEADGAFRVCSDAERTAWETASRQPCP